MKKNIIILLTVLLCCGCTSQKKLLEINRSDKTQFEQKDIRNEIKETEKNITAADIETVFKGEENIEVTHVKYDTSKPINPETGKPPVESETKIAKHSSESKDAKVSNKVIVEASKVEVFTDSTQLSSIEKKEVTIDEKIKKSLPLYIYIIGMGILAVAVYVIWRWLKRWRR